MPNIEDVTLFYELLIRGGLDGMPQGAHAKFRRRVTIDGELIKEEEGNAVPIDLPGLPTSQMMTDITRDALSQVTRLQDAMLVANEQIGNLNGSLSKADNLISLAQAEKSSLMTHIEDLQSQVASALAENARLATENEHLRRLVSSASA